MAKQKQEIAVRVGERIRYFRKLRGLSQEALGFECGLNAAFVGHIERGLKSPTIGTLEKLCNGLSITLAELFDFTAQPKTTREEAMDKIRITLNALPPEDVSHIANIVAEIAAIKK